MDALNTFPLIDVSGSARDMGYQHGAQAKLLIDRYLVLIELATGLSRDVLCRNVMAFLPRVEALSSLFVEEVRGLAEGADISFEEALLCQARSYGAVGAAPGEEHCTSFAVKGAGTVDGEPLAGQNQDNRAELADVSIVLRVKPADGRPRVVMHSYAGQLGYHGMNEHGVSNFTNSLPDLELAPGQLHYPLKRVMMERRSTAECVALLRKERICGAANIFLCDGRGHFASAEVRPEKVVLFRGDDPDRLVHSNHYLTDEFASYNDESVTGDGAPSDSYRRLDRMHVLMQEYWGSIDVDTMKSVLGDHEGHPAAICRHGARGSHSIAGYIAEPARNLLHVRRGHGCTGSWQAYEV